MLRKLVAPLGIAVSLAGLAINFQIIVGSMGTASATNAVARSLPDVLVYFWTFYTHLTNLWLVLVYLSVVTEWRRLGWLRGPVALAAMAGNITLVMLFYHFMLAPFFNFTGGLLIANELMHYAAPILYLLWWAAFAPHGTLRLRDVPLMLRPGIVYVAWVLARGAIVHEYPYAILDAGRAGYLRVAVGVVVLIGMVAIFCALLVFIDRRLGRRRTLEVLPSTR